jgi:hypothetical protein
MYRAHKYKQAFIMLAVHKGTRLEKIAWSLSEVGRKIEEKIKKQERKSLDAHFYFIHTYIYSPFLWSPTYFRAEEN